MLCPALVNHVLRCGPVLSAPTEQKREGGANETSILIHKLKTQINTLVNARTPQARLTAAVLVKTVVDVGGWQCLQSCKPWVLGLLATLQVSGTGHKTELSRDKLLILSRNPIR